MRYFNDNYYYITGSPKKYYFFRKNLKISHRFLRRRGVYLIVEVIFWI